MVAMNKISLKYPNRVPGDYDISQMKYTFDFINLVLNHDFSIENAVESVGGEYRLSETYLMDYLVENKYLLNRTGKDEFLVQLKRYNTKTLKKILKRHGLKASGKREKLEKLVYENNLLGTDYYLSSKSRVFYKNKKRRMKIFNEYLCDYYYFNEFNDFYMDSYRKKEANIPIEFISLFINKTFEDENHEGYLINTHVMAKHFMAKENYRKALEYVLKNYCMNLNPIWKINHLKGHSAISPDTYGYMMDLRKELSRNTIINTYYLVWDSFNFDRIIVSKYDGYRCLKDILNMKSPDKINTDLNRRFYCNDDLKIKKITQKTLFDF